MILPNHIVVQPGDELRYSDVVLCNLTNTLTRLVVVLHMSHDTSTITLSEERLCFRCHLVCS